MDIPSVDWMNNGLPSRTNVFGAKACGESGASAAPPAVMNAIVDALVRRPQTWTIQMPARPSDILALLQTSASWVATRATGVAVLTSGAAPMSPIPVRRASYELLNDPVLNKGIAFTEAERDAFGLHGLLPPHVGTLDEQDARCLQALEAFETDLERYDFLRDMQDHNETAFYALLTREIEHMLPLVYTPTVGLGCQRFSHIYRKPRGIFLSFPIGTASPAFWQTAASTRWRRSSSPMASASLASVTKAWAAWASRSASCRSTRPMAAYTRLPPWPSCLTSAPTGRICWTTRSTSAGSTAGCAAMSTTTSSRRS